MKYSLTLFDKKDLRRICALLIKHEEIMKLLNEDSSNSPNGGANMHYEVKIELKEIWG